MTANQISLRNVKELERHNLATEQLEREKNQFTDAHYQRADYASLLSAQAAQSQAAAAHRNAAVNEINAATNRMAAEAHIQYEATMAGVNQQKVDVEKEKLKFDIKEFEWTKDTWKQEFGFEQQKQAYYQYATNYGLQIKESEMETGQKKIGLGYAELFEKERQFDESQDLKTRQYETERNQGWVRIVTQFGGDVLKSLSKTKTSKDAWDWQ